jgi:hypothetical protein
MDEEYDAIVLGTGLKVHRKLNCVEIARRVGPVGHRFGRT